MEAKVSNFFYSIQPIKACPSIQASFKGHSPKTHENALLYPSWENVEEGSDDKSSSLSKYIKKLLW